ncbi:MAG: N-acetylmuramic acid 6-phosphate etherase [Alphaproteobacteria bacterium]|nr:N-acetylmuramic acid 6-phosphate etherase [Alphaproteobacteria bacterium]
MDLSSPLPDTEKVNPLFEDFEAKPLASLLHDLLAQHADAVIAVQNAAPALELAIEACAAHLLKGGRLLYAGAGTSGRLGVMDGAELMPTFGWPMERVGFLIAGGMSALTQAQEGVEDDVKAACKDFNSLDLTSKDAIILLSASGVAPYVLELAKLSTHKGCLTIGVANSEKAPLLELTTHPVLLRTGPEALQGSTRLKAGTAQKVFLSTFSTALMAKLGYVYKGFMINLQPTNEKLRQRQRRILVQLTGLPEESAGRLLNDSNADLRIALLKHVKGVSSEDAHTLLVRAKDNLHLALTLV